MARIRVFFAVLTLMVAVLILVGNSNLADATENCFCGCMKEKCMVLRGVTREDCAPACNKACLGIGAPGQPHPGDYCGF